MFTRFLTCLILIAGFSQAQNSKAPEIFDGLLTKDKAVKAQIGMVLPPSEIDKYVAKVAAAARKNAEWFKAYSEKSKPGLPLPYDEKLGLTVVHGGGA